MSCSLTAGRLIPCKDVVAGIKDIYFFNYGVVVTESGGAVSDIKASGGTLAADAYRFQVKGLTGLEETVVTSRDNGTTFWEQVLSATLPKLSTAMRTELQSMAQGRPIVVIHDYNGNAILLGKDNGMEVTGGTTTIGQSKGDLSGYTLTLTGQEKIPACFVTGATTANPFAGIAVNPPTIVSS